MSQDDNQIKSIWLTAQARSYSKNKIKLFNFSFETFFYIHYCLCVCFDLKLLVLFCTFSLSAPDPHSLPQPLSSGSFSALRPIERLIRLNVRLLTLPNKACKWDTCAHWFYALAFKFAWVLFFLETAPRVK